MHELSIAMSVVDMASEEAERRGARVTAVHMKLGALSGVVKEALLSACAMASETTPLEGSTLVIEDVPVVVFCPRCQDPTIFNTSDVALITKIDMADAAGFDEATARASIEAARPGMAVHLVSAKTGRGLDGWLGLLEGRREVAAAAAGDRRA